MRVLIPAGPEPSVDLTDIELESLYPWPSSGTHLRANMVMTLTGAIADGSGSSRGISSPADRRLLGLLRRRCDALLVGAGTIRAEGYSPLRAAYAESRIDAGQRPAPVLVVVSRTLDLPLASPLFHESVERPLIVTCTAASPEARQLASDVADVVDCGDTEVDLTHLRPLLQERGLPRIHCEGGPRLLTGLLASDDVDELLLTISPIASPPGESESLPGGAFLRHWDLAGVLEDSASLFCRYQRRHAA